MEYRLLRKRVIGGNEMEAMLLLDMYRFGAEFPLEEGTLFVDRGLGKYKANIKITHHKTEGKLYDVYLYVRKINWDWDERKGDDGYEQMEL